MYRGVFRGGLATALLIAGAARADSGTSDIAKRFGTRQQVIDISIAPDGQHVAYVMPGTGHGTRVVVSSLDPSDARIVARADGNPLEVTDCGWTSPKRLLCNEYGLSEVGDVRAPFTRIVALDMDGGNMRSLARQQFNAGRISQFDGEVIDWLSGDGNVLMMRDYIPEGNNSLGPADPNQADGMGVDRVDSVSGHSVSIEHPVPHATEYISDGHGVIRIVEVREVTGGGDWSGKWTYRYRLANSSGWQPFSRITPDDDSGLRPIAVDGAINAAYALRKLDGRDALYRVKLDGTMQTELVYANPTVDVRGVVTIGRSGRVIGAAYVTDRRQIDYFDPGYRALAQSLAKALPQLPLVYFLGASTDEQKLLIFAGSDVDPGHYYEFDRATRHLAEIASARPELAGVTMAPTTGITYPAADGTPVPAYLTLPPGGAGKNLPAIVLPHGGPASRDEWGFDWLAQYFAQRGFAVLQPEFRGSSGYGDGWYVDNGFKSWKTAIGDITDGARWLKKQGIAAPDELAIVGWSYGGYAALQANVVDPSLFKAVVAIAPVTSLAMLKRESRDYTSSLVVSRFVGDGPHIAEGSPLEHPDQFQAPVLMFHGDQDINVGIGESQAMDKALHAAGKQSRLVVYPRLDHALNDSDARADMLSQADTFLRTSLHLPPA